MAQIIFDRVWLAEVKAAAPGWLACREVFDEHTRLGGVTRCRVWHKERRERLCG